MRDRKFRAWDARTKELIPITGFKYVGKKHIQLFYLDEDGDSTTCTCEKEFIELLEYTGIKDKNDVEIYEGDLITGKLEKVAVVKWLQENCSFVGYCKEDNKYYYLECGNLKFDNIIVVGNVYENPELLEGGKSYV